MTKTDNQRRFQGVDKIYGTVGTQQLQQAHICIVGLGGVGSWAVEALARSAVGELTVIDMDHVAESNINRQIQATTTTLGQAKTLALQERIHSINPVCQVNVIDDFVTVDNQDELLTHDYDWVIDCIDNYRVKAAMIAYCKRQKIKIITMGGAGGMVDPSRIKVVDMARTKQDPLLAKTRKLLRQEYNFPQNPKRRFSIPCVFSEENLRYPDTKGGLTGQKPAESAVTGLNCATGFGSAVAVTATFGFFAAAYVLNKIASV
ncbi:MAG TPA: tRNA cyclic N6-threonylcarbamoyladenosine(37) synthase TcdA [Thiotrichaceae bacterium]|nr:tRNA cyclic N6-threonylcarbamoyladenosine(37) synthase TcdA [Thiotrichaceae bacterium]